MYLFYHKQERTKEWSKSLSTPRASPNSSCVPTYEFTTCPKGVTESTENTNFFSTSNSSWCLSVQEPVPLSLPQLNRLVEASFVRDESSASNDDVTAIPSQYKVTKQILLH
jgi:hypothetical protein